MEMPRGLSADSGVSAYPSDGPTLGMHCDQKGSGTLPCGDDQVWAGGRPILHRSKDASLHADSKQLASRRADGVASARMSWPQPVKWSAALT
jgi:hypothetical protein